MLSFPFKKQHHILFSECIFHTKAPVNTCEKFTFIVNQRQPFWSVKCLILKSNLWLISFKVSTRNISVFLQLCMTMTHQKVGWAWSVISFCVAQKSLPRCQQTRLVNWSEVTQGCIFISSAEDVKGLVWSQNFKIAVENSFSRAHPPPTKVSICQKPTLQVQPKNSKNYTDFYFFILSTPNMEYWIDNAPESQVIIEKKPAQEPDRT